MPARIIEALAEVWPDPVARRKAHFGATPGTPEYHRAYARWQYDGRVAGGISHGMPVPSPTGLDVLEIGCGHGGISCYFAAVGAKSVLGIDLNDLHLGYARELAATLGAQLGRALPVRFEVMNAMALDVADASLDLVIADNLFEHVDEPERLMAEAHRVLRPGGTLLVPAFSAIRSKYGLHLKHGLRLPWMNLVFSEATIVEALHRRAERHPELYDVYPGLRDEPQRVRDVRRHKDLNDITHAEFLEIARRTGLELRAFRVEGTMLGRAVFRVAPQLGKTGVGDVLSKSAGAVLRKPA